MSWSFAAGVVVMRCLLLFRAAFWAVAVSLGAQGAALAGAWPLGEREALAIAGASFADSTAAFDASGKLIPVSAYRKFDLSLYVEYGVSDAVTLVARPSFADITTAGPPAGGYRGFEAMEAGARALLARAGDAVFSAQGLVRIPGSTNAANPALVGATAFEAEARLLAGYSFHFLERPAFAEAQIAWRARDGGNPGEARLDLTLGARIFDRLQILLQSFSLATTGAGTAAYPAQRLSKLQPSLVYDVAPGWSVQAGVFATVYAVNARREQGVIAAVWRKF